MSRRRKGTPPSYCLHKQSGQAAVNWPIGGGKYKTILLGRHGSPESHVEYQRLLAEWRASHVSPPSDRASGAGPPDLTLSEIALAFDKHAERYYRHLNGEQTGEAQNYKDAMTLLLDLYGHVTWREFGPNSLRAIQTAMVEKNLARKTINARINRIRRVFKWAVSREMVPGTLLTGLMCVAPLRRGEQVEIPTKDGVKTITVKESPGVHAIPWERVDATMPFLSKPVAAMVQIMRFSNCRAQDVVSMRGCDLDMTGEVWVYEPAHHKNSWREEESVTHKRYVYFGPLCQEIIRPFLKDEPQAYLFSPRQATADYQAQRAVDRKTKKPPSQLRRKKKKNPKRAPRDRYSVNTFQQSVRKACLKAGQPTWTVLEVRHTRATDVREQHGVEGAAASLGDRVEAAQIYAERNKKLARQIALEMG